MNKEALHKAISGLEIKMVYIYTASTSFHNNFDPLIPNQELVAQFRLGTKHYDEKVIKSDDGTESKFIRFFVEAGMRYAKAPVTEEDAKDEAIMNKKLASEVTAIFIAEYIVTCENEIPSESLQEFGNVNAPHNVWPYWREYCHSTLGRMSMPVNIVPMLKIN